MSRTLHDECKDGNIEAVKEMIANGADIHMLDNNYASLLHIASKVVTWR